MAIRKIHQQHWVRFLFSCPRIAPVTIRCTDLRPLLSFQPGKNIDISFSHLFLTNLLSGFSTITVLTLLRSPYGRWTTRVLLLQVSSSLLMAPLKVLLRWTEGFWTSELKKVCTDQTEGPRWPSKVAYVIFSFKNKIVSVVQELLCILCTTSVFIYSAPAVLLSSQMIRSASSALILKVVPHCVRQVQMLHCPFGSAPLTNCPYSGRRSAHHFPQSVGRE